jgi:acetyl esterase/lipase
MRIASVFILWISITLNAFSQQYDSTIYKQIDTVQLQMDIYYPEQMENGKTYPGMVFFFGGGWNGGTVKQFEPHARYLSSRGIICFLADYRVKNRQGTTPFESLMDAKSAVRYIRKHAGEFQVDPDKIIAAGGSAGGHLAAATALVQPYNEPGDPPVSCVPNALVLFNPVIDNGPGGYGYERIGEHFFAFSPLHNIRAGAPPTIFFLGTADNLIPVETAEYYQTVMEKVGSRCELHLYEGAGHGFFNKGRAGGHYYKTVLATDKFLTALGYLSGEPTLTKDSE